MLNRPAMYAACPPGRIPEFDNRADDRCEPYGTCVYREPLSMAQLYQYEMVWIDPLPSLPLWPEGTEVYDLRNKARTYTVEFFDGEYWVGDSPMRTLRDWRYFEVLLTYNPPLIGG